MDAYCRFVTWPASFEMDAYCRFVTWPASLVVWLPFSPSSFLSWRGGRERPLCSFLQPRPVLLCRLSYFRWRIDLRWVCQAQRWACQEAQGWRPAGHWQWARTAGKSLSQSFFFSKLCQFLFFFSKLWRETSIPMKLASVSPPPPLLFPFFLSFSLSFFLTPLSLFLSLSLTLFFPKNDQLVNGWHNDLFSQSNWSISAKGDILTIIINCRVESARLKQFFFLLYVFCSRSTRSNLQRSLSSLNQARKTVPRWNVEVVVLATKASLSSRRFSQM